MKYLYEMHTGGLFITDSKRTSAQCYCEVCEDCDYLIGTFETINDFWYLVKDLCETDDTGGFSLNYVFPIMVKEFNLPIELTFDKTNEFCTLTTEDIMNIINEYCSKNNITCDQCIYECSWKENRKDTCERFKHNKLYKIID